MKMNYTHAIVRGCARSVVDDAQRIDAGNEAIDFELIKTQKEAYYDIMEKLGIKVIKIEADETLPDCVFTEDAAVIIGKRAVVTRLGHPNRRGESVAMKSALLETGLEVFDMNEDQNGAQIDGGDVLFTGTELFVGLSARSNQAGVDYLRGVFKLPTHGIRVLSGFLHLKSNTTLLKPGKMLISDDAPGRHILEQMKKHATSDYEYILVPEEKGSNVVYIRNGATESILMAANLPQSAPIIKAHARGAQVFELDNSELAKVDGCLTCCSVLFSI